ncbi:MAG TPA: hypothetical protein VKO16_07125, partial [Polyangia bacterium]|nr:hypothetical protein [Polyangia bacterium]
GRESRSALGRGHADTEEGLTSLRPGHGFEARETAEEAPPKSSLIILRGLGHPPSFRHFFGEGVTR